MATGKKSVIIYIDLIHVIEKLTDQQAGQYFKHFLRYVNDLNPIAPDNLIDLIFEPQKQQLKRDLKDWEKTREKRSESGRLGGLKSGEIRKQNEANEASASNSKQKQANEAVTVNVNVTDTVTVNDTVNVKEKNKNILLSKIDISDFPEINHEFYEIAISFYELFKSNLIEAGASTATLEKANLKWIDEIRLMSEIDKVTTQDFRDLYAFLKIDTFWKQNILSTKKLREKYPQLKLKIHAAKQQFTGTTKKTGNRVTEEYERNILERLRG